MHLDDGGFVEEERQAGTCERVAKGAGALEKIVVSLANKRGGDALEGEEKVNAGRQIVEVVVDEVSSEGDEVGL
jgi:hypothetical protein